MVMMNKEILQIGLDVGSTTVKAVVMNHRGTILFKDYQRHKADQARVVRHLLLSISDTFPHAMVQIFVTGSGGRGMVPYLNAQYVQEVNAVTYAVERLHPDAGSAIELGGQDAKVIIWKHDNIGRKYTLCSMNDKCAGGTGAILDKLIHKIGIHPDKACKVTARGKTIHHIAAKCGVFAETDMIGLLKAGIDRDEIIVSICNAIVKQNLEVLVRGNILRDKVLLLGGPHFFYRAFEEIWRIHIKKTWEIHKCSPQGIHIEKLIFVPDDAQYFASIGAVLFGKKSYELIHNVHTCKQQHNNIHSVVNSFDDYMSGDRLIQLHSYGAVRDGLVKSEKELDDFKNQFSIPPFKPPKLTEFQACCHRRL
jgi:activator of 2-hydroxyglutaryl-CoA dehydratase